jgi:hypothetical protein
MNNALVIVGNQGDYCFEFMPKDGSQYPHYLMFEFHSYALFYL